jgi:hypothetical protein
MLSFEETLKVSKLVKINKLIEQSRLNGHNNR